MNYRITKYNPEYHNEDKFYTRDEWTKAWQIGRYYRNSQFTAYEYFAMEKKYWTTLKYLLELYELSSMKIRCYPKIKAIIYG